jgi:hypothetical protein
MPSLTDSTYSDLWHGDEARDWAGRGLDCCPEPRPEDIERWRDQAGWLRAEDARKDRRARAARIRAAAIRRHDRSAP